MATIPTSLDVPSSALMRDSYAFTDVTTSLERTMSIKGRYLRKIDVELKINVGTANAAAATGFLHQLLALSSFANGRGKLVGMMDGRSGILMNKLLQPSSNEQAIDYQLTGTVLSSFFAKFTMPVNFPSFGLLDFQVNLNELTAITGVTNMGATVAIGIVAHSTDDLVGTPYRTIGGSFNARSEVQFYQAAADQSRYQIFEVAAMATADLAGASSFTTPDGNLSPTAVLQHELDLAGILGVAPGQDPAAGPSLAMAVGNSTLYYPFLYRAKGVGNAGFTADSNYTGAWAVRAAFPASDL